MKPIALLAALALIAATPASAQNASQIAAVRGGADCPKCNLFQADLGGLTLKGKNYAGARLRQADFSLGIYNRSNFAGADLRDVNAYGGLFSSANFSSADLTNASFVGTFLEGADFRGAKLEGANFSGAEMDKAQGLSQGRLDQACGDAATKLPAGLTIPACRG